MSLTQPPSVQCPQLLRLLDIIAQLRDPKTGCPWDIKQTHQTLKPYLLEEAYECLEAIDEHDAPHTCEELGDVLLQVVLHAQIAKEAGTFDFERICQGIADKIVRRHPHVFGSVTVTDAEDVTRNWDEIKQAEKGEQAKPTSILDGVSKSQPALSRALETSKRAVKVGFEWPNIDSLWACVMSEFDEFQQAAAQNAPFEKLEDEMGDIFFASVNLARHYKIDPEVALSRAIGKFSQRFKAMEQLAGEQALDSLSFEAWDALWNQAKEQTQL